MADENNFKITLNTELNTSKAREELNKFLNEKHDPIKLTADFSSLEKSLKNMMETMNKLKNATKGFKVSDTGMEKQSQELKKATESGDKYITMMREIERQMSKTTNPQSYKVLAEELESVAKASGKTKEELNALSQTGSKSITNSLAGTFQKAGKEIDSLTSKIDNLLKNKNLSSGQTDALKTYRQELQRLANVDLSAMASKPQTAYQEMHKYLSEIESAKKSLNEFGISSKFINQLDSSFQKVETLANKFKTLRESGFSSSPQIESQLKAIEKVKTEISNIDPYGKDSQSKLQEQLNILRQCESEYGKLSQQASNASSQFKLDTQLKSAETQIKTLENAFSSIGKESSNLSNAKGLIDKIIAEPIDKAQAELPRLKQIISEAKTELNNLTKDNNNAQKLQESYEKALDGIKNKSQQLQESLQKAFNNPNFDFRGLETVDEELKKIKQDISNIDMSKLNADTISSFTERLKGAEETLKVFKNEADNSKLQKAFQVDFSKTLTGLEQVRANYEKLGQDVSVVDNLINKMKTTPFGDMKLGEAKSELNSITAIMDKMFTKSEGAIRFQETFSKSIEACEKKLQDLQSKYAEALRNKNYDPESLRSFGELLDTTKEKAELLRQEMSEGTYNSEALDGLKTKVKEVDETFVQMRETMKQTAGDNSLSEGIQKTLDKLTQLKQKGRELGEDTSGIDALREKVILLQESFASGMNIGEAKSQLESLNGIANQTASEFQKVANIKKQMNANLSAVYGTGGKGLFNNLKSGIKMGFAMYTPGMLAASAITSGLSETKTRIEDIDKAMTNLKKIADPTEIATKAQLDQIKMTAAETAKSVAGSTADIIQSEADAIKAGANGIKEAEAIAKQAQIYANVGDTSTENATKYINSMLHAFNIDPLKKFTIATKEGEKATTGLVDMMDAADWAGNNYAIDVDGLGQALQAAGASMNANKTSFKESIAMITAANEPIQNAAKVGNGLKTIAQNLQGVTYSTKTGKVELSQYGQAIQDVAKIDIFADEKQTQVKSMYQIMEELSAKWDTLTDKEQKALSTKVAGKNQANVFNALMANWKQAQKMMKEFDSGEYVGTAERENAKYIDSIEGRISKLKNTWDEIGIQLSTSDAFKELLDVANKVSEVVGTILIKASKIPNLGKKIMAIFAVSKLTGFVAKIGVAAKGIEGVTKASTLLGRAMQVAILGDSSLTGIGKLKAKIDGLKRSMVLTASAAKGNAISQIGTSAAEASVGTTALAESTVAASAGTVAMGGSSAGAAASTTALAASEGEASLGAEALAGASATADGALVGEAASAQLATGALEGLGAAEAGVAGTAGALEGAGAAGAGATAGVTGLGSALLALSPYILTIAAVGAGIWAIKKWSDSAKEAQEKLNKEFSKQTDKVNKDKEEVKTLKEKTSNLDTLINRYEELSNKQNKSTQEQQEYKKILQEIAKIDPELVKYDKNGNAVALELEEVKKLRAEYKKALKDKQALLKSDAKKAQDTSYEKYQNDSEKTKFNGGTALAEWKSKNIDPYVAKFDSNGDWIKNAFNNKEFANEAQKYFDNLSTYADKENQYVTKLTSQRKKLSDSNKDYMDSLFNEETSSKWVNAGKKRQEAYKQALSLDFSEFDEEQARKITQRLEEFVALGDYNKMPDFNEAIQQANELSKSWANGETSSAQYVTQLDGIAEKISKLTNLSKDDALKLITAPKFDVESATRTYAELDKAKATIQNKLSQMASTETDNKDKLKIAWDIASDDSLPKKIRETAAQVAKDGNISEQDVKILFQLSAEIDDKRAEAELTTACTELLQSGEKEFKENDARINQIKLTVNSIQDEDVKEKLQKKFDKIKEDGFTTKEIEEFLKLIAEVDDSDVSSKMDKFKEKYKDPEKITKKVAISYATETKDLTDFQDYASNLLGDEDLAINITTDIDRGKLDDLKSDLAGLSSTKQIGILVSAACSGEFTPTELSSALSVLPSEVQTEVISTLVENNVYGLQGYASLLSKLPAEQRTSLISTITQNGDINAEELNAQLEKLDKENGTNVEKSVDFKVDSGQIALLENELQKLGLNNKLEARIETAVEEGNLKGLMNDINTLKTEDKQIQVYTTILQNSGMSIQELTDFVSQIENKQVQAQVALNVIKNEDGSLNLKGEDLVTYLNSIPTSKDVVTDIIVNGGENLQTLVDTLLNMDEEKAVDFILNMQKNGVNESLLQTLYNQLPDDVKKKYNLKFTSTGAEKVKKDEKDVDNKAKKPSTKKTKFTETGSNSVKKKMSEIVNTKIPDKDISIDATDNASSVLRGIKSTAASVWEYISSVASKISHAISSMGNGAKGLQQNVGGFSNISDTPMEISDDDDTNSVSIQSVEEQPTTQKTVSAKSITNFGSLWTMNTKSTPIDTSYKSIINALKKSIELFTELNNRIARTQNQVDLLNKQMERTVGTQRIKQLETQNKLYAQQAGQQKILYEYLKKQRSAYMKEARNLGVKFNSQGNFTNYDELLLKAQANVDSLQSKVDKLNSTTSSSSSTSSKASTSNQKAQEAAQKQLDSAQKKLEELKTVTDAYMNLTNSEIPQAEQKWQELQNSIKANKDEMEKLKLEADLSPFVNAVTEAQSAFSMLEQTISLLDTYSSKAQGSKKIDFDKSKLSALNEELKKQNDIYEGLNSQVDIYQNAMKTYGVKFDSEGAIANYKEVLDKYQNDEDREKVKELLESYNTLVTSTLPEAERKQAELNNTIKDTTDEIERLQREYDLSPLKNQVTQLTSEFDSLGNKIDLIDVKLNHAYGIEKIELTKQKIQELSQQMDKQHEIVKQLSNQIDIYKDSLSKYGVEFNDDGSIKNYADTLDKFKDSSDLEKINDLLSEYNNLINSTIPNAQKQYEQLGNTIKDMYNSQLDTIKTVEDKIKSIYEKQLSDRKSKIQEESQAEIDLINKVKEQYEKNKSTSNYNKQLQEQQEKIAKLNQQIEQAKRDDSISGKSKLQSLYEQLESEQESLQDIIDNRSDSLISDMFSEQTEKIQDTSEEAIKNLEDIFTNEKLYQMIDDAISSQVFTDIDGNVSSLQETILKFAKESGDALGFTADRVNQELVSSLQEAVEYASKLSTITTGLGINAGEFNGKNNISVGDININVEGGDVDTAELYATIEDRIQDTLATIVNRI